MFEYPVTAWLRASVKKGFEKLAHRFAQAPGIIAIAASTIVPTVGEAGAEDRSLKLFFTHTGERTTITFKRNGEFDPKGLAQINRFLRDWRRNEPARMDPRLLDLVWEVYQRSGASDYVNVVSAYRSPATNNMLRGRSRNSGVAKKSQHTLGKAMDFFIPGVKLSKLRAVAMQMQVGGVGYYPTSGSPFVHLDVGRVRAWPRMSRQELVRVFPNGGTLHVPADGKPLPGYNVAMADYKRRVSSKSITVASTAADSRSKEDTLSSERSLVSALLPTPKSRAKEALEMQTMRRAGAERPAFFDLTSINVPLPTFRPAEIDRNLDVDTSAFIPSSSFKLRASATVGSRTIRQPTAAESSLSKWRRSDAPTTWTVSTTAVLDWALAPTEKLEKLTLPAGLQHAIKRVDAMRLESEKASARDTLKGFNVGRFGSDS